MNLDEKINLLEDALELEIGTLTEDTLLVELPEYDSMAKLSLIVLADDEFSKKLTGETLRDFNTVRDILEFFDN